jgi:hypothetical protein
MSTFEADNRMWKNLILESPTNFPLANWTRLVLFLKDIFPYKNDKYKPHEILKLRELAKTKGLLSNTNMKW